MKYAIYSDVHANLEALEAVYEDMDGRDVDCFVCLGDLVGYGADPEPVLERIVERASVIVAGNHDYAVAGKLDLDQFNQHARRAVNWTRDRLPDDYIGILHDLPLQDVRESVTFVHASPRNPEAFGYIMSAVDAHMNFQEMETDAGFVGHSHVPGNFHLEESLSYHRYEQFSLNDGDRAIVNVGSVGQPRDKDPRACYALYDTERRSVRIRRVDYDIETAAEKIYDASLPTSLGDRLFQGK